MISMFTESADRVMYTSRGTSVTGPWEVGDERSQPPTVTMIRTKDEKMKLIRRRDMSQPYHEWVDDAGGVDGSKVPWYFRMTKYDARMQSVINTKTITPFHLAIDLGDANLLGNIPPSLLKTFAAYTHVWKEDGSPPDLRLPLSNVCEQYINFTGAEATDQKRRMLQNIINRTTSALETADPNGRERIDGVICTTFQAIVVMVHTTTITDTDVLKRSGAVLYQMREGRGAKIDEGDPQGTYAKMLKEIDDASKMRSRFSEKQKQQELAARKQRAEEEARRQEEERRRQDALLERLGVPGGLAEVGAEQILARTKTDKKRVNGRSRFILGKRVGEVEIVEGIEDEVVLSGIEYVQQRY